MDSSATPPARYDRVVSGSSGRYVGIVALALALSAAGAWYLRGGKYAAQIRALRSADPTKDAAAAAAAGDYRFMGVMGFGLMVPGVEDYWHTHATAGTWRSNVRVIPNTSDAIESREHARLQEVARSYAERYNVALLKLLPATHTAPTTRSPDTK